MRNITSILAGLACCAAAALVSNDAAAHIELLEPAPRYELPANKSCPCGDGDSNRVCQDTAEESTDPNRSQNVTTFEAGATITIRAEEYIDHDGRMRVAFDPEGADLADFNENILLDVPDPSDSSISQANPLGWDLTVTLPDTPCENCTLQVIQVMNGVTDTPVADPAPLSTYYTCADIRIVPAGTLASDPNGGSGGSASAGAAAAGGAAGAGGSAVASSGGAAGAGGSAVASSGGAAGSPGASAGVGGSGTPDAAGGVEDAADAASDDGGCSLQQGSGRRSAAWLIAGVAAAAVALLRRRRR